MMVEAQAWRTTTVREVEARFDAAVADVHRHTAELRTRLENLRKELRPSAEDTARLKAALRAGDLGEEGRALQRRIDQGDLTWDDLTNGKARGPLVESLYRRFQEHIDAVVAGLAEELAAHGRTTESWSQGEEWK